MRALKKAGLKIDRHKEPTKGQKDYVARLYRMAFAQGPIISRKLNKKQLKYFHQTDIKIYKGRAIIPTFGNTVPKIVKNDFGWTIERKYDNVKTTNDIVLANGARIDREIVSAFKKLKKDQYLFVGTNHNRFSTRFRSLEDFTAYVSNFDSRWNKNEKQMSELFEHVSVVSINRGQAKNGEDSGSR